MFKTFFSSGQLTILVIVAILHVISIYFFSYKRNIRYALFFLVLGGLVLRLLFINFDAYFFSWDEQYHALVAQNMAAGNPFVPMLFKDTPLGYDPNNWTANHIWLHKQPLFLWQIALSIKILGSSFFAVRLPSAIMSTLLIPVIFRIGKRAISEQVGYIAAFLFALCNFLLDLITGIYNTDHNDVAFIFYVTLSFWAYTEYRANNARKYIWLIGIFAGCAILNKWMVGLVVFSGWGISLLFIPGFKNKLAEFKQLMLSFGSCVLVFLPWQIYILNRFPAESRYEYAYNSKHFFEALENHSGSVWYHFEQAVEQYGWLAAYLLPLALVILFWDIKDRLLRVSFITFVVLIYTFFTVSKTKMPVFCLILAPIMFVALGNLFYKCMGYLSAVKINKKLVSISEFVLLLLAGILSLNVEKVQANHTDWIKTGSRVLMRKEKIRATAFANSIKGKYDTEKTLVFNCNATDNIPVTFFSGYTAFDRIPTEKEVAVLKNKGYTILYINDFKPVPDHIKNTPGIIFVNNCLSYDVIRLKTSEGKFVCADGQQNNRLYGNRDQAGSWETFELITFEDNECAIRAYNGLFLSAELNSHCELTASRTEIGGWEIFRYIKTNDSVVIFKGANEKYLTFDPATSLIMATADMAGEKEKFRMIKK